MACSGLFGAGQDGLINPPDRDKYFTLHRADIVVKSPEIHRLLIHFEVLIGMIEVGINFFKISVFVIYTQDIFILEITCSRERERKIERVGGWKEGGERETEKTKRRRDRQRKRE